MSIHECMLPPRTRTVHRQSQGMERAQHSKPCHRHGQALQLQPGISLGTYRPHGVSEGKPDKPRKKLLGKSCLTSIYFTLCCTAISELPALGQAWDKPGLPESFQGQEKKSPRHEPVPKRAWWCSSAVVWGCQISGHRETPFSTGPHTYSHTPLG